ncbi:GAF domain-containing protein [Hymenobacter sp. GOD-10R]|uniref:GAF domain-containing protein n=1 Tax=Hymenobacter sp. GOD-10R TaxID=3093922 RepID=UPI002D779D28|nr:GAF domain-containing protein [Hymenobacter sp. GOD-10R]WRQ30799.1 GAF domain-containing protein [Hymenobacter sp. GOD-10R]
MVNTVTPFPASLIPDNDAVRLRTLHQYRIVNTTPEKIFDEYAAWAAQLFNLPIALISLVDEDQVWFKATVGAQGIRSLTRGDSMCSAAILHDDAVVLSDYSKESCGLISQTVAEEIGLRFYAGAALQMPDKEKIGMLAVIGREPRDFSEAESELLVRLAQLVSQTIELRGHYLAHEQADEWEDAQQELAQRLDDNATLARYLTTRTHGIDLADEQVAQVIYRRLNTVQALLQKRLAVAA